MENDSATPDSPKPTTPSPAPRDPLIRYSVFAALGCAGVCMIFTILYVFSYSLDSTLSFERHFDAYLASGNTANLSTVLGLHMAQNRMFLQSCGMVAGIFFAFLGLALFLVGIQGTADATGQVRDYSTSLKRLAPGGIILLASMIFVGVSAMHPIDLTLSPLGASTVPTATVAQPAPQPAATQPATQSLAQPAAAPPASQSTPLASQTTPLASQATPLASQATPITPQTARLIPQSAPQSGSQSTPHTTPAQPAIAPAPRPISRTVLVPVSQTGFAAPPLHRFQP